MKTCNCCKIEKEENEENFYKKKSGALNDRCKICCRQASRDFRVNNKEIINIKKRNKFHTDEEYRTYLAAYQKEYHKKYSEENKEKLRQRAKEYYQKNRDSIRAKHKAYRERREDFYIDYRKKKYEANRDEILRKNKEYRKRRKLRELSSCNNENLENK